LANLTPVRLPLLAMLLFSVCNTSHWFGSGIAGRAV